MGVELHELDLTEQEARALHEDMAPVLKAMAPAMAGSYLSAMLRLIGKSKESEILKHIPKPVLDKMHELETTIRATDPSVFAVDEEKVQEALPKVAAAVCSDPRLNHVADGHPEQKTVHRNGLRS